MRFVEWTPALNECNSACFIFIHFIMIGHQNAKLCMWIECQLCLSTMAAVTANQRTNVDFKKYKNLEQHFFIERNEWIKFRYEENTIEMKMAMAKRMRKKKIKKKIELYSRISLSLSPSILLIELDRGLHKIYYNIWSYNRTLLAFVSRFSLFVPPSLFITNTKRMNQTLWFIFSIEFFIHILWQKDRFKFRTYNTRKLTLNITLEGKTKTKLNYNE